MIFSELYSAYYNTVAEILTALLRGEREEKALAEAVREKAFSESVLTVLPNLKGGKWQLVRKDLSTPIRHRPTMPLTDLQKRWLKAISLDPRIALFGVDFSSLEDVPPLFTKEDILVFDRYNDGDDFTDPEYIGRFRLILSAIHEKQPMKIRLLNREGKEFLVKCLPVGLEYSEKDDKFRLITAGCPFVNTINLGKITDCHTYTDKKLQARQPKRAVTETLTFTVTDERSTLERCLLHFAHFEKQVERLDEKHYRVSLVYDKNDESELIVRVLSFGPFVEVISPDGFRRQLTERLKRQRKLLQ